MIYCLMLFIQLLQLVACVETVYRIQRPTELQLTQAKQRFVIYQPHVLISIAFFHQTFSSLFPVNKAISRLRQTCQCRFWGTKQVPPGDRSCCPTKAWLLVLYCYILSGSIDCVTDVL